MTSAFHPTARTPIVVAHRAGNDPTTARTALSRADVIEADTHVYRGRVEVRHEKVLWPSSRLWERWYLLPRNTRPTRIDEVLAALPPDTPLLIDLKCFTVGAARRIRDFIPATHPVIASSRSWWTLRAFRDRNETVRLRSCRARWHLRLALALPGLGDQVGVVAHNELLSAEAIAAVRSRTSILLSWAVPTAERGRDLVAAGVTGLIVDDLELDWPKHD